MAKAFPLGKNKKNRGGFRPAPWQNWFNFYFLCTQTRANGKIESENPLFFFICFPLFASQPYKIAWKFANYRFSIEVKRINSFDWSIEIETINWKRYEISIEIGWLEIVRR